MQEFFGSFAFNLEVVLPAYKIKRGLLFQKNNLLSNRKVDGLESFVAKRLSNENVTSEWQITWNGSSGSRSGKIRVPTYLSAKGSSIGAVMDYVMARDGLLPDEV